MHLHLAYRDRECGDNGRTPGQAQLPLNVEALCAARSILDPLERELLPMLCWLGKKILEIDSLYI
jgi:hypothetical protein